MSKIVDKLLEAVEKLMEKCREKELYQTLFYIKIVAIPVAAGVLGAALERGDGDPTTKDNIAAAVYIGTGLVIAGLCALPAPVVVPITLTYDAIAKAIKNNKNETVNASRMHAEYLTTGHNVYRLEGNLVQQAQAMPVVDEQSQPRQKQRMNA